MKYLSLLVGAVAITALAGFGTTPKTFDQGYSDGYAVGYNTTCQVRGTYLNGDWDSRPYRHGYRSGLRAGVRACLHGGRAPVHSRRRWQ
jgi:hypothetical protein